MLNAKQFNLGDQTQDYLEEIARAPFAAFLIVAAADGEVEPKEFKAFVTRLREVQTPLLQLALIQGPNPEETLKYLIENKGAASKCLAVAGEAFRKAPNQETGLEEIIDLASEVAKSNTKKFFGLFGGKDIRPQEMMAILAIRKALTTPPAEA